MPQRTEWTGNIIKMVDFPDRDEQPASVPSTHLCLYMTVVLKTGQKFAHTVDKNGQLWTIWDEGDDIMHIRKNSTIHDSFVKDSERTAWYEWKGQ